jgi:hypothetical protein
MHISNSLSEADACIMRALMLQRQEEEDLMRWREEWRRAGEEAERERKSREEEWRRAEEEEEAGRHRKMLERKPVPVNRKAVPLRESPAPKTDMVPINTINDWQSVCLLMAVLAIVWMLKLINS